MTWRGGSVSGRIELCDHLKYVAELVVCSPQQRENFENHLAMR